MLRSEWSAEEVVFQKYQYLLWEPNKVAPDYGLRMRWLRCMARGAFPNNPWCMEPILMIGDEAYWSQVFNIAATVYWELEPPPEGCEGVTNFDNPAFWINGEPPWAEKMELGTCIEDHCFWRPKTE